ncbi:Membrane protein insertase YidC [invertebrate metagenome]|uniref:Membrane protein insertase YidC n=1 Tax=invertebrate metagenome TaxID=1711999 RepID=A0A2H9T8V5_9ZZZZ
MDLQRTLLIGAIAVVGVFTLRQWNDDYHSRAPSPDDAIVSSSSSVNQASDKHRADIPVSSTTEIASNHIIGESHSLIKVKTDALNVSIDPVGGNIVNLSLPQYPAYLPKKGEVAPDFQLLVNHPELFSKDATKTYVAQSGFINTDSRGKAVYNIRQGTYKLKDGEDSIVVDLFRNDKGIDITKRYVFERGSYDVKLDYIVKNNTQTSWKDRFYAQLKRDGSEDPSRKNSNAPMNTYLGAAVKSNEKNYQKLPFDEFSKEPLRESVQGGYAAMLQHYFVTAWVPDQQTSHDYYTNTTQSDGENYYFVGFQNLIEVKPDSTVQVSATLYAGPKLQDNLKSLADGLELTVDYGILWFLAQPIFKLLHWIQSFIGNWGWSIILLTVVVKAVFYPLNATSFRSMAKMRKLGPKMQSLKEQYADDKQKLSQAMMTLYKKEKVNPMGGCLPILVQMPVFIALYWVLQETVELRQAPWLLWIEDLSQMDPYFILPLIMGASMFLQQMLNPTPPDPTQAKVMKLMPVIFTFFFLWFPAGLVLYWVTNNTLSIIQQYIITRRLEVESN